jgi:hypothetical protein
VAGGGATLLLRSGSRWSLVGVQPHISSTHPKRRSAEGSRLSSIESLSQLGVSALSCAFEMSTGDGPMGCTSCLLAEGGGSSTMQRPEASC